MIFLRYFELNTRDSPLVFQMARARLFSIMARRKEDAKKRKATRSVTDRSLAYRFDAVGIGLWFEFHDERGQHSRLHLASRTRPDTADSPALACRAISLCQNCVYTKYSAVLMQSNAYPQCPQTSANALNILIAWDPVCVSRLVPAELRGL